MPPSPSLLISEPEPKAGAALLVISLAAAGLALCAGVVLGVNLTLAYGACI